MRRIVTACLFSVVVMAPVCVAEIPAPPKVEQALKRALPNAKCTVEDGPRQINGVGVYDVEVSNKFGRTVAEVTEHGDFLISPVPSNPERMPGPVDHVVNHLFKSPPATVQRYEDTVYIVNLSAGGKESSVVYDAVGRIVDIRSAAEMKYQDEEFKSEGQEGRPEIRHQMEGLCDKMEDKAKIEGIYKNPDYDNFYVVVMTNDAGKRLRYVTNGEEVYARTVAIDEQELPPAVRQAVRGDFKADSITGIVRRRHELYQFDEQTGDGDVVTLKIDADGKILSAVSRGAAQEAIEAKKRAH